MLNLELRETEEVEEELERARNGVCLSAVLEEDDIEMESQRKKWKKFGRWKKGKEKVGTIQAREKNFRSVVRLTRGRLKMKED